MKLLIIGSKSVALEIYDAAISNMEHKFKDIVFLIGDNEEFQKSYSHIRDSELKSYVNENSCEYIISFSNHKLRSKFEKLMKDLNVKAANIIHNSAVISENAEIGIGNYLAAGAIISYGVTIGNHNVVNFNTTIGHDAIIGEHVIINPGARISGNVIIKNKVLIGTNSIIYQGKQIGCDVSIDALTYIDKDIVDNVICSNRKALKILKKNV